MANPEPTFLSTVEISEIRTIGIDNKHLKIKVTRSVIPAEAGIQGSPIKPGMGFDAIAFGMGDGIKELKKGDTIKIAYTLSENTWNDKTNLQLKIKDIKTEANKKQM